MSKNNESAYKAFCKKQIEASRSGLEDFKLEMANLDDQLSKTNTLDFEELKSELSQVKREIEAEDRQQLQALTLQ